MLGAEPKRQHRTNTQPVTLDALIIAEIIRLNQQIAGLELLKDRLRQRLDEVRRLTAPTARAESGQ
jgi:hypothetical protein